MFSRELVETAIVKRIIGRVLAGQSPPDISTLGPETMRRMVIIMALEGTAAVTDIPHRDLIDNAFQLGNRVREQLENEAVGETKSQWDMERGTESSVTTP